MRKVKMKFISCYITLEQHKKLRVIADERGIAASETIRRALDMYFEKVRVEADNGSTDD